MSKSKNIINAIIDEIIAEGRKPTVRLVRERAGNKFSFTTIGSVLRERKKDRDYHSVQQTLTQLLELIQTPLAPKGEIETRVFEAANTLLKEGSRPTNRSVRELIGKYSYKDISPALKKWKDSASKSVKQSNPSEAAIKSMAKKVISEFEAQGLVESNTQNASFDEFLDETIRGSYEIPNDRREKLLEVLEAKEKKAFFQDTFSLRNTIPDWVSAKYNLASLEIIELIEDLDVYTSVFDQLKSYK